MQDFKIGLGKGILIFSNCLKIKNRELILWKINMEGGMTKSLIIDKGSMNLEEVSKTFSF